MTPTTFAASVTPSYPLWPELPAGPAKRAARRASRSTRAASAHAKALEACTEKVQSCLAAYTRALADAGLEPDSTSTSGEGNSLFDARFARVLQDPVSGVHVVVEAALGTSVKGRSAARHELHFTLSTRAGARAPTSVMVFVVGTFELEELCDGSTLEQALEGTPASLLCYFTDQALAR